MTQNELNRAVARATGESVNYIREMGFSLQVVPAKRHYRRPSNQAQRVLRVPASRADRLRNAA